MALDNIFVIIAGVLGIVFTYWFFLMKKQKSVAVHDTVTIMVDGGYSPEIITISQGKTTALTFLRKDPSNCLEEVVLGDFKIRQHLPLHQKVTIELTPEKSGEFTYTCGMNMYHGKIIVV